MKKKPTIALIVFCLILACFYILSRAISYSGVAIVSTSTPSYQTITKEVTIDGTVQYKNVRAVMSHLDQVISVLYVEEGDQIQIGDKLFKVDEHILENELVRTDRELRKKDLEISEIESGNKNVDQDSSSNLYYMLEPLRIERVALQEQLDSLIHLRESDYIVYSDITGVVDSIKVNTGEIITNSAVILVSDPTLGTIAEGIVPEENVDQLEDEMIGKIKFRDGDIYENLDFKLKNNKEDSLTYISVDLDDIEVEVGSKATITLTLSSSDYSCCVPKEAIYQEGDIFYVYVVEEKQGFFGSEESLRRVTVNVLETMNGYAALSDESLSSQQQIVIRSDRVLNENSKVRIASE